MGAPDQEMSTPSPNGDEAETQRRSGAIDPRLLEILVCPLTKTTLHWDAERQELVSRAARLAFPVRAGVPIMLAQEARTLDD
jgi:hypothetical protein